MNEVKLYNAAIDSTGSLIVHEDPYGQFVTVSDYRKLESRLIALQAKLEKNQAAEPIETAEPVEAKHTEGPWIVEVGGMFDGLQIRSMNERDKADAPMRYVLAERIGGRVFGENWDDYSEVDANAALMSASPNLYKALKAIIDACDRCIQHENLSIVDEFTEDMEAEARQALTKATDYAAIARLRVR